MLTCSQRSQRLRGHGGSGVNDHVDTCFVANFSQKSLQKIKICETVYACSYRAQVEFFFIKSVENLVTLSLSLKIRGHGVGVVADYVDMVLPWSSLITVLFLYFLT